MPHGRHAALTAGPLKTVLDLLHDSLDRSGIAELPLKLTGLRNEVRL
jgi:hypothetical protein